MQVPWTVGRCASSVEQLDVYAAGYVRDCAVELARSIRLGGGGGGGWRPPPFDLRRDARFNYISFLRPFLLRHVEKTPVLFRITVGEKCFRVLRRVSWFDLADVPSFPFLFPSLSLSVLSCTLERKKEGEEEKENKKRLGRFFKSDSLRALRWNCILWIPLYRKGFALL